MELNEFVFQTITQIADGIKKAQEAANDYLVSPPHKGNATIIPERTLFADELEQIDFDIAVTTADKSTTGGGISVVSFNIGAKHSDELLQCSRIKFQVSVRWPRQAYGQ